MSSAELSRELAGIDAERLEKAKQAFLSVDKSFTIRRRQVTGTEQFDLRLRRAIAAYQSNSAI